MIKNNNINSCVLYAILLLIGILLPLHNTAQTLPTTESTDEPDITLCQAGQKIPIGNCSDATSFMWSPTTGLTPDSDPKKAQIKVSPTETTVYTRTATRNTPSGVVKETWKVRVMVIPSGTKELYAYLRTLGFEATSVCFIKGTVLFQNEVEVRNLSSNQVFDYANLQIEYKKILFNGRDKLQELEDFLETKGLKSTGFITKNLNICDGKFIEASKKYQNDLNTCIWWHFFDMPNSDKDILLYKTNRVSEEFQLILQEFAMKKINQSSGYNNLTKEFLLQYVDKNSNRFTLPSCKGGTSINSRVGYLLEGAFIDFGIANFFTMFSNFRGNTAKMCSLGKQPTEPDGIADADGFDLLAFRSIKIRNGTWFEVKATDQAGRSNFLGENILNLSSFQIRDHIDNMECELTSVRLKQNIAEFYLVTTSNVCISPFVYLYAANKTKTPIEIANESDDPFCFTLGCRNISVFQLISLYKYNIRNEMEIMFGRYDCRNLMQTLILGAEVISSHRPVVLKCP